MVFRWLAAGLVSLQVRICRPLMKSISGTKGPKCQGGIYPGRKSAVRACVAACGWHPRTVQHAPLWRAPSKMLPSWLPLSTSSTVHTHTEHFTATQCQCRPPLQGRLQTCPGFGIRADITGSFFIPILVAVLALHGTPLQGSIHFRLDCHGAKEKKRLLQQILLRAAVLCNFPTAAVHASQGKNRTATMSFPIPLSGRVRNSCACRS